MHKYVHIIYVLYFYVFVGKIGVKGGRGRMEKNIFETKIKNHDLYIFHELL